MKHTYIKLLSFITALSLLAAFSGCKNDSEKAATSSLESEKSSLDTPQTKTSENSDSYSELLYAEKLFTQGQVHTIDIAISEDDWNDLLENPFEKTKYKTNVTIDGETISDVSFASKGNTSLSSVADDPDSNRYSFKLNFGKYIDGQNYYGLDKLNLNNLYADATYMKDYISYRIFSEAGIDSPLTSYVWLTINGEAHGLYLAIEEIGDSYLNRTENGEGELYKPETEHLANMNEKKGSGDQPTMPGNMTPPSIDGSQSGSGNFTPPNMDGIQSGSGNFTPPDLNGSQSSSGNFTPPNMNGSQNGSGNFTPPNTDGSQSGFGNFTPPDMSEMPNEPGGGFGSSSNGASLKYSDDNIKSYSDIFDNSITDVTDEDEKKVVNALKGISEGKNIEEYADIEKLASYFAAHNFVLNYDSYTGNMLHNYYLYEKNGKLSMLPWDYNLSFGAFSGDHQSDDSGTDPTELINTGIDTPLSGCEENDRPMWQLIISDEKYTQLYHDVYEKLLTDYFESGEFETEIDKLYEMLKPYIEKDPSSFYTAEEYTKAYKTLKNTCILRAKSIRSQLNGTLSTKTDNQKTSDRVNASSIVIKDMGSQGVENDKKATFNNKS